MKIKQLIMMLQVVQSGNQEINKTQYPGTE